MFLSPFVFVFLFHSSVSTPSFFVVVVLFLFFLSRTVTRKPAFQFVRAPPFSLCPPFFFSYYFLIFPSCMTFIKRAYADEWKHWSELGWRRREGERKPGSETIEFLNKKRAVSFFFFSFRLPLWFLSCVCVCFSFPVLKHRLGEQEKSSNNKNTILNTKKVSAMAFCIPLFNDARVSLSHFWPASFPPSPSLLFSLPSSVQ